MARIFQPDHNGLNQIARSPEVRAALMAVGAKTMGKAVALAQDFRTTKTHPHYADAFKVESTTVDWKGDYPGIRGCVEVSNTSDHAAAVEWGNARDTKPHHVLGRVLGAMGVG